MVQNRLFYLLLLLYGILHSNAAFTTFNWNICPIDVCTCEETRVVCKNNEKNLTYIPRLPIKTKFLEFTGNILNNVTLHTFRNLSNINLTYLSLAKNDIRNISSNAFATLQSLEYFDLSLNRRVSRRDLQLSLGSLKLKKNGSLILNDMDITQAEIYDLFCRLPKRNIIGLSLASNIIQHVDSCLLTEFVNLENLRLAGNKMRIMTFNCSIRIKSLDLNSNKLTSVPNFCSYQNTTSVPFIEELILSDNNIKEISDRDLRCIPVGLRKLNVLNNRFTRIVSKSFHLLQNLERLDISSLYFFKPKIMDASLFESSSIKHINMRLFAYDGRNDPHMRVFRGINYVSILDMSNSRLTHDTHSLHTLFTPLKNLTRLILKSVKLQEIPNIFHRMRSLIFLDLSDNLISSIDFRTLQSLQNLVSLDVSHNKIISLDVPRKLPLPLTLKEIDLSNNMFDCSDEIFSVTWSSFKIISLHNISLRRYPKLYYCSSPEILKGKPIPVTQDCESRFYILVFSITITTVVCFAIAAIVYRSIYRIRYWIYMSKCRYWMKPNTCNKTIAFDGFVIYCQEDERWLLEHFIPFIEEKHGYKLCIHSRDFQYGRLIVDNIVENMKLSRKIVLILSDNLARSKWCQFELLLAHERFLEKGPDSLVSIKLEEIRYTLMTNTLETLIKFATHAIWSECHDSRKEFWVKILDCFKRNNESYDAISINKTLDAAGHENLIISTHNEIKNDKNTNELQEIKCMFTEICSQVNKLNEAMYQLEERIQKDITSLSDKVNDIESNIKYIISDIISENL